MLFLILFLNLLMPLSRKMKLFLTGLLIVFLGGYGSLLGFDGIISRFSAIDDSGMTRFHFYTSSFPLLLDHWLTGIGTGSYKLLSGVYLKEFPESLLIDRAHNDYLEFAIEVGLPMASVCFVWLFTNIFVTGKKLLQKSREMQEEHRVSLIAGCAAFCSLSGFLIHGLVDFGWRLPANTFYAVTLVAIISWALQEQGQPESGKNPVPVVD
jgi:O-antigen ligase